MDLSWYLLANSLTKFGGGSCHADTNVKQNDIVVAKKNPKIILKDDIFYTIAMFRVSSQSEIHSVNDSIWTIQQCLYSRSKSKTKA